MKRRSFFLNLFLGNLIVVALIVLIGGFLVYRSVDTYFQAEARDHHADLTRLTRDYFQQAWPMDDAQAREACRKLAEPAGVQIRIIDADGRVRADSAVGVSAPPRVLSNVRDTQPEVQQALLGQGGWHVREGGPLRSGPHRYHALPIRHEGRVVAAVQVAMAHRTVFDNSGIMRNALLWAALTASVAAVLLGLLVSWLWYAPVRQITYVARKLASGDLTSRARMYPSDELADLSRALNDMRDKLTRQLTTVAAQGEDLQTVVASLEEGVVAVDHDGKIALMNMAARRLLSAEVDQPKGHYLQAVARVPSLMDLYDEAIENAWPVTRRVDVDADGQRIHLQVYAAPVISEQATKLQGLIVLRDITDATRTADIKAEFVANASHELRTPLATIRAAAESLGMELDDPHAARRLLGILNRHVVRLENMTNDLLDLHLVERPREALVFEEVTGHGLAHWMQGVFAGKAQERDVSVRFDVDPEQLAFRSERKLVQLILQNLVDNAIKYNKPGGSVDCSLRGGPDEVVFSVADTGRGIRPEDQSRVFERFYQADAARSGDTSVRGTGLGLAIVKHAAERLRASISLRSALGEGTTITVRLPVSAQSPRQAETSRA